MDENWINLLEESKKQAERIAAEKRRLEKLIFRLRVFLFILLPLAIALNLYSICWQHKHWECIFLICNSAILGNSIGTLVRARFEKKMRQKYNP